MVKNIFYNTSLPRAGSSLINNIIMERPDFHCTGTDGALELIFSARQAFSTSPEFKANDQELMKSAFLNFCREGLYGYCNVLTERENIVLKSRGFGIHYNLFDMIIPEPKMICMVRDVRDIFASLELKFRGNQHISDPNLNWATGAFTTSSKRIDVWATTPPLGIAMERLKQIFDEGIYKKICFVRYEDLLNHPQREMDRIYRYFGVETYEHDFNNIVQYTQEDDTVYGIYGDHKIKNSIQVLKHNYPTTFTKAENEWIHKKYSWFNDYFGYKL